MIEKVYQFGLRKALTGILCRPHDTVKDVGVIFLNSGILHSVGASRIHVLIARDLAALGVPSMRFDQSTIGDSGPRFEGGDYLQSAIKETRSAIEELRKKTGVNRIILFGLCSGSDVGFLVAKAESLVHGLVQLDPYVYRTARYHWTYYRPRLAKFSSWKNFLCRKTGVVRRHDSASEFVEAWFEKPEYVRVFPPKEEVAANYRILLDQGVRFLTVFSGGQVYAYNHKGQLRECFSSVDFGDRLQEEFFPESSHIFTDRRDQLELRSLVKNWVAGFVEQKTPVKKSVPFEHDTDEPELVNPNI